MYVCVCFNIILIGRLLKVEERWLPLWWCALRVKGVQALGVSVQGRQEECRSKKDAAGDGKEPPRHTSQRLVAVTDRLTYRQNNLFQQQNNLFQNNQLHFRQSNHLVGMKNTSLVWCVCVCAHV